MNPTDKMMAWAQIGLSALLFLATFAATAYYLEVVHTATLSAEVIRSIESVLDKMWTATGILVFFWFQRQRTAGIPDVASTVTQTTTAPDGSKTVTTSPVGTPPSAPLAAVVAPPPRPAPVPAPAPRKPTP